MSPLPILVLFAMTGFAVCQTDCGPDGQPTTDLNGQLVNGVSGRQFWRPERRPERRPQRRPQRWFPSQRPHSFCSFKASITVNPIYVYVDNRMTHDRCWEYCKANGFPVAFMANGGTCGCGFWKSRVTATQEYCNTPCRGDPRDNCGGPNEFVNALDVS